MNIKINFSKFFKIGNILSVLAITVSVIFLIIKGLNYGVDFKGGTLLELRVSDTNIKIQDIRNSLKDFNLGDVSVKEFGKEGDFLIKFEKNSNENKKFISELKSKISGKLGSEINFRRVESVGPKVSNELLKQGITAIALSLAAMLFYIWIRFEWQFSLGSIIALFHDVIITLGIFSILSLEVNLSIVAAVLTIVGYSMNDTVVIYDRIRENLLKFSKLNTNEIANISLNETLSRTVITSMTTLLALGSIFILGGEILKGFSFAMILGVIIGTYSSIFVASPVLKYFKVTQKTLLKEDKI
ncbi:MAG: protein translocase subunit SecF [Pelagibacteraceae bacterium]|jgi:preprotein translocase subunit SecF|nr:protein translocase subunit SecF [Pelagibacteraceae bacterium]